MSCHSCSTTAWWDGGMDSAAVPFCGIWDKVQESTGFDGPWAPMPCADSAPPSRELHLDSQGGELSTQDGPVLCHQASVFL